MRKRQIDKPVKKEDQSNLVNQRTLKASEGKGVFGKLEKPDNQVQWGLVFNKRCLVTT